MRLFCSYAFTGEDIKTVSDRMRLVVDSLAIGGHEAYCPLFDRRKIKLQAEQATKEIFDYAFENIAKCDGMVAIISSNRKSEGQLMEIGANLANGKPLYVFIHYSAAKSPSHMQKLATKVYIWSNSSDLAEQLANIKNIAVDKQK